MRKVSRRELGRLAAALATTRAVPLGAQTPASRESFLKVRDVYGVFQAADRVEQEVFPADHSFWGKRGIPFMAQHL